MEPYLDVGPVQGRRVLWLAVRVACLPALAPARHLFPLYLLAPFLLFLYLLSFLQLAGPPAPRARF